MVALASGLCVYIYIYIYIYAYTRIYAAAATLLLQQQLLIQLVLEAPCLLPIIFEKGIIWVSSPPLKFLLKLPG